MSFSLKDGAADVNENRQKPQSRYLEFAPFNLSLKTDNNTRRDNRHLDGHRRCSSVPLLSRLHADAAADADENEEAVPASPVATRRSVKASLSSLPSALEISTASSSQDGDRKVLNSRTLRAQEATTRRLTSVRSFLRERFPWPRRDREDRRIALRSTVSVTPTPNQPSVESEETRVTARDEQQQRENHEGSSDDLAHRRVLSIDLHPETYCSEAPQKDETIQIMPPVLSCLSQLRHLRHLKLTRMTKSYQRQIWRAVWMNPQLEFLSLEMYQAPILNDGVDDATIIHGDWKATFAEQASGVYHGDNGRGILHRQIGWGAYFDWLVIKNTRDEAVALSAPGQIPTRISLARLQLTGFAVSDTPFFDFFNPAKLRRIELSCGCIDLGFALPLSMKGQALAKVPRSHESESLGEDRVVQKGVLAQRVQPGGISNVEVKLPPHLKALQAQIRRRLEQAQQGPS